MVILQVERVAMLLATIMATMMQCYVDGFTVQSNFDFAVNMRRRRRARRQRVLAAALAAVRPGHGERRLRRQPVDDPRQMRPRSLVWWEETALHADARFWKENFRMTRQSFQLLCNTLSPSLQRESSNGLAVEKVVAIALYRLSTPCDLRTIGNLFGVGRSTVCEIVQEVCKAVVSLMLEQYIVWPADDRLRQTIDCFEGKYGFPQCAGAVDGTHIPIIAPKNNPADYHNRKGQHSIILQAVVDDKLRFTDINVGWPGRVHDARWNREINGVLMPIVILGDPAYPLLPWLMKGFSEGVNFDDPKRNFNYRLSRARMVVERGFGQLKGRWRILMRRNDSALLKVPQMVSACCVLHNFCLEQNEGYDDRWDAPDNNQPINVPLNDQDVGSGVDIRNALLRYFS
ncbi:protein ALP1-like [Anneissia japonica]|uniref:protein ALP1-like n=1 Tax=Anneissia japonica TaxID=1529436 RepID=UPI0014258F01|nr:protein ALP1-like [Anneissia japonica]